MADFDAFCSVSNIHDQKKIDQALHIMFYIIETTSTDEVSIKLINEYFDLANLPKYNVTFLKRDLLKSSASIKGKAKEHFKLNGRYKNELVRKYASFFTEVVTLKERANLSDTPYLNESDIKAAHQMSELYMIIHCYENSVRKYLEKIFEGKFGSAWSTHVLNSDMNKKFSDRKGKEDRQRWISPRGSASPLYYLDWDDLVKLFRKFPELFQREVPDIKFIELRFEELERIRNIVAHNGILPSEDDLNRIVISFKDWCRQIPKS